MNILLAIPLGGDGQKVRANCERVQNELELLGFDVLNPLDIPFLEPFDWLDWSMRNSIMLWNEAEALYLMEGWDDDNACSILALIAEQCDVQIFVEKYSQDVHRNFTPLFKRKKLGEED